MRSLREDLNPLLTLFMKLSSDPSNPGDMLEKRLSKISQRLHSITQQVNDMSKAGANTGSVSFAPESVPTNV